MPMAAASIAIAVAAPNRRRLHNAEERDVLVTWRWAVVRHDQQGHTTEETQRGPQPIDHGLAWCGIGEGVARRPHGGDEDVGPAAIRQGHRGSRVVGTVSPRRGGFGAWIA